MWRKPYLTAGTGHLSVLYIEVVRQFFERAAAAFCARPAEFFTEPDKKRMVLIKKLNILRQVRLEQVPKLFVFGFRLCQLVTNGYSCGVGIHDKDGPAECVEQNRIGGLAADTFYSQKLSPELFGVEFFEIFQSAFVILKEPGQEAFQTFCFYIVIAGWPDKLSETRCVEMIELFRSQQVGGFQIRYCLFDISPACILRQDSACDNLELGLARPPVLGAEALKEQSINFSQLLNYHRDGFSRITRSFFDYCNFYLLKVNSAKHIKSYKKEQQPVQ